MAAVFSFTASRPEAKSCFIWRAKYNLKYQGKYQQSACINVDCFQLNSTATVSVIKLSVGLVKLEMQVLNHLFLIS